MVVAICRVSLMIPESQSLKEKRSVLRRIKESTRHKFNVAIAEVDENDAWQTGVLGFALVANERRFVESMADKVIAHIDTLAKISNEEKDFVQYGDEPISAEEYEHWEPDEAPPLPTRRSRVRAPRAKDSAPFPWEKEGGNE